MAAAEENNCHYIYKLISRIRGVFCHKTIELDIGKFQENFSLSLSLAVLTFSEGSFNVTCNL